MCLEGDFIEAHDDTAVGEMSIAGKQVTTERKVALVWHLSKNFDSDCGGMFVDLDRSDQPCEFAPRFNRLVAFVVPRMHAVTPMATDRSRFSVFGWLVAPMDGTAVNAHP